MLFLYFTQTKSSQSHMSNLYKPSLVNNQRRSESMYKIKAQRVQNSNKYFSQHMIAETNHDQSPQIDSVYSQVRYSTALLANLKTAFMLFVVTLIMAIVYTPSILTSVHIIEYNPIHWNIIYINNAVNPIVYSFLNPNFRKNLKDTFKYCFGRLFKSASDIDLVKWQVATPVKLIDLFIFYSFVTFF